MQATWGPQNKGTKEIKLQKGEKRGPRVLTKLELDKNVWGESRHRNMRGTGGRTTGLGGTGETLRSQGDGRGEGLNDRPPECEGWGSALSLGDQCFPGFKEGFWLSPSAAETRQDMAATVLRSLCASQGAWASGYEPTAKREQRGRRGSRSWFQSNCSQSLLCTKSWGNYFKINIPEYLLKVKLGTSYEPPILLQCLYPTEKYIFTKGQVLECSWQNYL